MPGTRFELAQDYSHMDLNHARLPIPPPGQCYKILEERIDCFNSRINNFFLFLVFVVN